MLCSLLVFFLVWSPIHSFECPGSFEHSPDDSIVFDTVRKLENIEQCSSFCIRRLCVKFEFTYNRQCVLYKKDHIRPSSTTSCVADENIYKLIDVENEFDADIAMTDRFEDEIRSISKPKRQERRGLSYLESAINYSQPFLKSGFICLVLIFGYGIFILIVLVLILRVVHDEKTSTSSATNSN